MLIGLSITLHVIASIFLKLGAIHLQKFSLKGIITDPYYIIALFTFGCQAIIWQYTLLKSTLAEAYMWTSAYYPALLAASVLLFSESITFYNIVGACIIMVGMLILADSMRETDVG